MIPNYKNNDLLRRRSKDWDFSQEESLEKITAIASLMATEMTNAGGIGLAAPQIEVDARIIVLACEPILVLINPEIIEMSSETSIMEEGCLSHPNLFVNIRRSEKIKLKYYTMGGDETIFEFSGMTARVIQHEMEHLDGKPFYAKASRYSIDKAKKAALKKTSNPVE